MPNRLQSGLRLFRQSFALIKQKKSLILLPILSSISILIAYLLVLAPTIFGMITYLANDTSQQITSNTETAIFFGLVVLFLFITTFITLFFNAALIACALQLMQTGDCKIRDGLKTAMNRLHVLFLWSLVATTVGIVIQLIQNFLERWPILEAIFGALAGMAWSITTFFVTPTLVVENISPIKAIKRSSVLMQQTWGKSLGYWFGIGLLLLLFIIISLTPAGLGIYLGGRLNITIGISLTIFLFIGVHLLYFALRAILVSGLYLYATGKHQPGNYDQNLLKNAFGPKKRKR